MSLGFTNTQQPKLPKLPIVTTAEPVEHTLWRVNSRKSVTTLESVASETDYENRSLTQILIVFNFFLVWVHLSLIIYIAGTNFSFPLTFFETRLKQDLIQNISCIYEYGNLDNSLENEVSYCSDPSLTRSGNFTPTPYCRDVINSTSYTPGVSDSGSPIIEAYTITRFGQGNETLQSVDERGQVLAKSILLTIESTTLIAHAMYGIFLQRLMYSQFLRKYFLKQGGIPFRWIEYAITASLMSLLIANVSNLFEFFGIFAITLGTFSLMFFGIVIEKTLADGYSNNALMFAYIPAFAIFLATWVPILQSLSLTVFELSCVSFDTDTWPFCSQPTCFGREVPILLFSLALLFLFCVFPLICIFKIYLIGGWFHIWDLQNIAIIRQTSNMYPTITNISLFIPRLIQFLLFVMFGGVLAWWKLLTTVLIMFYPQFTETKSKKELTVHNLLVCEMLFAIASVTSKVFLALFFTINFAGRNW